MLIIRQFNILSTSIYIKNVFLRYNSILHTLKKTILDTSLIYIVRFAKRRFYFNQRVLGIVDSCDEKKGTISM